MKKKLNLTLKNLKYFRCKWKYGLISLLLFSCFFNLNASINILSQVNFTLKAENMPVREFFSLIEGESDFSILFQTGVADGKFVTVDFKDKAVTEIMDEVLPPLNMKYTVRDRQIIITEVAAPTQKTTVSNQDPVISLTGKILDINNEPLIGATISIKGTDKGVTADIDGNFHLSCKSSDILVIQYLGYIAQEVQVGNQNNIIIRLVEDIQDIADVVITAFGTGQKKETVVGSIQTIRPSDLRVPSSNLSTSFAGRMSGVVAFQRSGEPGRNGADFYIRGISTLSGITSPLIILDGVEVSKADLDSLDPEIIEGFSILKDATATAMYGTRGANGVMIVKTKSGANLERPIIGVRVEGYLSTPTKTPQFVSGADYMRLYNEAVTNQGSGDLLYTADQILGTQTNRDPYIYPNVNWYDEIFKSISFNQKANFNIRGGTDKITYFMNIGMNHESGMIKNRSKDFFSYSNNIDLYKYAFQNNIDFHMTKTSTISLHLNVQLSNMRSPNNKTEDIYNHIMLSNPVDFPIFYPNTGDDATSWIKWGAYDGGNTQGATNPMASLTQGYKDTFESTVIANIDFDQKLDFITKGLRFKALFSFKNWSQTQAWRMQAYNRYILDGFTENSDGSYEYHVSSMGTPSKPVLDTFTSSTGDRRIYFQTFVDYNRSFGKHNVGAMALYNQDEYNINYPFDLVSSLPQRKMGFAGRLSYDYAYKYLLEVNAGYNGSENFAKGHRFGFFPSVAVGWNISEENFWDPLRDVVNSLKIRGSYGLVGNDQIENVRFIYLSDIDLYGSDAFRTGYGTTRVSMSGPKYTRYQNNDISWEVGRKLNVGMDFYLFHSLALTLEGFKEIRSDIFQQKQSIPNYLGTAETTIYGNFAKVKNWGFEMSADYAKQFGKDWTVMFKGTFSFARNKVLEYDEADGIRPAMSQIGRRIKTHMGYVADGLYIDMNDIKNSPTSTLGNIAIGPGDIKYVDQPDADGKYDGIISSDDMVELGYPTIPEITYGFGPSVQYKNWDFSFFFQGVANTSLMISGIQPFGTQYNRNVLTFIAEDHWAPDNQNINAKYPRLTRYDNDHNSKNSDFWLRNAAFLKLKNAEVGYSYKNFRVYLSGMNLLTFSPFKHWDPEMGGGKGLTYPTQKVYNIGFQMTFK